MIPRSPTCISACPQALTVATHQRASGLRAGGSSLSKKLLPSLGLAQRGQDSASRTSRWCSTFISPGVRVRRVCMQAWTSSCVRLVLCAFILVCPAAFIMQISLSLYVFSFCVSFILTVFHCTDVCSHFYIYPHVLLLLPLLSPHPFAPSLSTPSSLLWSDQKANVIKLNFLRPFSIFPGVFSCVYICVCVCVWIRRICL